MQVIKDFRPDILIAMHRYPRLGLKPKTNIKYDPLFKLMQQFLDKAQIYVSKAIFLDRPIVEFPHANGPLEMAKRLLYNMDTLSMGVNKQVWFFRTLI